MTARIYLLPVGLHWYPVEPGVANRVIARTAMNRAERFRPASGNAATVTANNYALLRRLTPERLVAGFGVERARPVFAGLVEKDFLTQDGFISGLAIDVLFNDPRLQRGRNETTPDFLARADAILSKLDMGQGLSLSDKKALICIFEDLLAAKPAREQSGWLCELTAAEDALAGQRRFAVMRQADMDSSFAERRLAFDQSEFSALREIKIPTRLIDSEGALGPVFPFEAENCRGQRHKLEAILGVPSSPAVKAALSDSMESEIMQDDFGLVSGVPYQRLDQAMWATNEMFGFGWRFPTPRVANALLQARRHVFGTRRINFFPLSRIDSNFRGGSKSAPDLELQTLDLRVQVGTCPFHVLQGDNRAYFSVTGGRNIAFECVSPEEVNLVLFRGRSG